MISKKKRIEELEVENTKLNRQIKELIDKNAGLRDMIKSLESDVDGLTTLQSTRPNQCVTGEYCKSCIFSKGYTIRKLSGLSYYYVCGKAQSCPEFVQDKED